MSKTARLGEPIGHSPTMNWLLAGLLIGAAVAIAAVLIVGTGGLAAAAIVGATAATGAGIGEVVSTMSWVPKEIAGAILGACSPNVFINSKPAARAHLDFVQCSKHAGPPMPIATGSDSVFINSHPAARDGDKTSCGGDITDGSANVFIGGGSVQTDIINPEELVPGWVHMTLLAVGMASAIVLAGPFVAAFGLVGGMGGGYFGAWLGGKLFGVGSDGQKWTMLGGAFISGMLATKGGMWFDKNYTITTQGLGSNLGNVRITPRTTPIKAGELTKYQDFVDRSVVGDNLEGHEVWQHANLKANNLASSRLSTNASKNNPVIALERPLHQKVNVAQKAFNPAIQTPIENIKANTSILREMKIAPESTINQLEQSAIEHANDFGFNK